MKLTFSEYKDINTSYINNNIGKGEISSNEQPLFSKSKVADPYTDRGLWGFVETHLKEKYASEPDKFYNLSTEEKGRMIIVKVKELAEQFRLCKEQKLSLWQIAENFVKDVLVDSPDEWLQLSNKDKYAMIETELLRLYEIYKLDSMFDLNT